VVVWKRLRRGFGHGGVVRGGRLGLRARVGQIGVVESPPGEGRAKLWSYCYDALGGLLFLWVGDVADGVVEGPAEDGQWQIADGRWAVASGQ
jgi:hypothetical protein